VPVGLEHRGDELRGVNDALRRWRLGGGFHGPCSPCSKSDERVARR
jgi:hypothetical protein